MCVVDRGGDPGARLVIGHVGQRHRRELLGRRGGQALDLLDLLAHRDGGAGAAVGDALAQGVDVLVDRRAVGGEPGEQLLEPLRRLRDLVLGHHHRHGLHARDVVDRQLVELLLLRLQLVARDQDQHVAGDHLLRLQPGGVDRLDLLQQGPIDPRLLGAALGAQVRQAVVEAVVAQDGGEDRLTLQHALEEAVGDLVDGGVGVGGGGVGHGRAVLPAMLECRNAKSTGLTDGPRERQPPVVCIFSGVNQAIVSRKNALDLRRPERGPQPSVRATSAQFPLHGACPSRLRSSSSLGRHSVTTSRI